MYRPTDMQQNTNSNKTMIQIVMNNNNNKITAAGCNR